MTDNFMSLCARLVDAEDPDFSGSSTQAELQHPHPLGFRVCVLTQPFHYQAVPENRRKQMVLPHSPLETNSKRSILAVSTFHLSTGTTVKI